MKLITNGGGFGQDKKYPYLITYGHDSDMSSSLLTSGARRMFQQSISTVPSTLSMIGKCALGKHRERDTWPEDLPELKRMRSMRDHSQRANHFWEHFSRPDGYYNERYFFPARPDCARSCSAMTLQDTWHDILRFHGIRAMPSQGWDPQEPPFNLRLRVDARHKKSYYTRRVMEVRIGRPNGWRNVDKMFEYLCEMANEKISKECSENYRSSTFSLIAIDDALEIYQYDPSGRRLKPYKTDQPRRIQVFKEGGREEVESLLKGFKEQVPEILKNMDLRSNSGEATFKLDLDWS